jgi:DNA-binding XRE family transcriptional regulator
VDKQAFCGVSGLHNEVMDLPDLVVKYRSLRHMTQSQLAAKVGVERTTIAQIENGTRTNLRSLTRVNLARALVLGVPPMTQEDAEILRAELNIPEPIWNGIVGEMHPHERPSFAGPGAAFAEAMSLIHQLFLAVESDQALGMLRGLVAAARALRANAPDAPNAPATTPPVLDVHLPPKPRPDLGPGIVEQEIRTYGVPAPGGKRQPGQRRKQG